MLERVGSTLLQSVTGGDELLCVEKPGSLHHHQAGSTLGSLAIWSPYGHMVWGTGGCAPEAWESFASGHVWIPKLLW
jgi:hypothetical protein